MMKIALQHREEARCMDDAAVFEAKNVISVVDQFSVTPLSARNHVWDARVVGG